MKERIHWIDIAKGFAIICVFTGHTISSPPEAVSFVYSFHMPLFFLMSGYCFSARREFKNFAVNKLKSIILPIFSLGLTGAIAIALSVCFFKREAVDWKWTFLNPFVQYKEHSLLWYLPCLFAALMIFYGIVKLLKDKNVPIIILSFALGGASYAAVRFLNFDTPWNIPTALTAMPLIAVGYVMKKTDFSQKLRRIWIPFVSFAGCIIAGGCNSEFFGETEMHTNCYGNIVLFYIAALCGSVMVMSISVLIKKNAVLEYFGRNSLIFYALEPAQYFINFMLKTIPVSIHLPSKAAGCIVTFIAVTAICLICSAAAYIINRYFPFLIGKSGKSAD